MAALIASVDDIGLCRFLRQYPRMAIRPTPQQGLTLLGHLDFTAVADDAGTVTDAFELKIEVPHGFPRDLPTVFETGRRIPRTGEFHVNGDGSLCLGSPLRLLRELGKHPTLPGYASRCIVPYLFAMARKLRGGDVPAFGELPHGSAGALSDYADMMDLDDPEQARRALKCLGMKKRRANKLPCPCGCGKRLGACQFNVLLAPYRRLASRRWYKQLVRDL